MKAHVIYKNKRTALTLKQYAYYITYYKYNWHRDVELITLLEGEIEVNIHGKSYVMKEKDVMLINSNIGHATMARKPDSSAMVLHFSPEYFSHWFKEQPIFHLNSVEMTSHGKREAYEGIRQKMIQMTSYMELKSKSEEIIYESLFHSIISDLFIHFPPHPDETYDALTTSGNEKIIKIIDYINNHFREKITLEVLQEVTGYNKSYISQIIKQDLGINYYEYLTRVRMREAIYSLTSTKERISDISFNNGFSDVKSFNTAFKERFGKSPSEYRKSLVHSQKQGTSNDKIYVELETLREILNGSSKKSSGPDSEKNLLQEQEKIDDSKLQEEILQEVTLEIAQLRNRFDKLAEKIDKLK